VSGYEIVSATMHSSNLGGALSLSTRATCPSGKRVLAGGVQTSNTGKNLVVIASYPEAATQSWFGEARNLTSLSIGAADIFVYAICANVQ
jgi:hypothetical protein